MKLFLIFFALAISSGDVVAQRTLIQLSYSLTSRLERNFEREANVSFSFTNIDEDATRSCAWGSSSQKEELLQSRQAFFISFSSNFTALIGSQPQLQRLAVQPVNTPFAHEGGTFVPDTNEVWFTANQLPIQNTNVSCVNLITHSVRLLDIQPPIVTPNGLQYFEGSVYVCSQGNSTTPGGIYSVNPTTLISKLVVNSWYGFRLNSPNDVTFTRKLTGRKLMWFTDPQVAYEQSFGSRPQLGSFVYRFDLTTSELRPIITDLIVPNGIAFSFDEKTLYLSDTSPNDKRFGTYFVYAYDLDSEGLPMNRRVFSVSSFGIPDGIKVDGFQRVWTGENDGINVRDKSGTLLGVILGRNLCESGIISNFAIVGSTVIILAQEQLWRLALTENII